MAAPVPQRDQPRRGVAGQVSVGVPERGLDLRLLAAPDGRGERERRSALHDPAPRLLPGAAALERRTCGAPRVADPRRVGGAAATRRLRRCPLEGRVPCRDAARGGRGARPCPDCGAARTRVRPLRRRRVRPRARLHPGPGMGAVLDPRPQQAAARPHRLCRALLGGGPRDARRRLDGRAVRRSAPVRVERLPRPAPHCLHQLAHARPPAPPHRAHAGRGKAAAPALRVPTQPTPEGIRQRRRIARRDAGPDHSAESGRLLRVLSCLPLLSGLHRARLGVRRGPLRRRPVPLLRLPARPETASRGPAAADRGVRRSVIARDVASPARGDAPRGARRAGDGRTRRAAPRYVVGIAPYRPDRGQFRLPGLPSVTSEVGFEFALVLDDTSDAQLFVAPWYNPYLVPRAGMGPTGLDRLYNQAAAVDARRQDGVFDSLFVTTNRWRIGRDGRTDAARGVNRGRLRFGRAQETTLADWWVDRTAGLIEVRLPWALLNVTDPSSRRVMTP